MGKTWWGDAVMQYPKVTEIGALHLGLKKTRDRNNKENSECSMERATQAEL